MKWLGMSVVVGIILFFIFFFTRMNTGDRSVGSGQNLKQASQAESTTAFGIKSSAFVDGTLIPAKYTCDGLNVVPPLEISNIPQGTVSLALIVTDPDAQVGVFDHWVVFNIAPTTNSIEEGKEPVGDMGIGTSGTSGYFGPCPSQGTHRYIFTLYALDTKLKTDKKPNAADLETLMQGHILDTAKLIGMYGR